MIELAVWLDRETVRWTLAWWEGCWWLHKPDESLYAGQSRGDALAYAIAHASNRGGYVERIIFETCIDNADYTGYAFVKGGSDDTTT